MNGARDGRISWVVGWLGSLVVCKFDATRNEFFTMTLTTFTRSIHEQETTQIPVRRAAIQPIGLMELANQMRADEQLRQALYIPGTALLGLANDGVPLMIRLASPDVTHVLISGHKGAGKTQTLVTMLAGLVLFQKPREIQLFLMTEKADAFQFLTSAPHLNGGIAVKAEQALQHLRWLEAEMERRENENATRPRLIVAIDSVPDIGKENGHEFQVRLARLAQRGRAAGISLLVCHRDNDHSLVTPMLKAYFPVRLAATANQTERAFAHTRGIFDLFAGGERVRFQTALLDQNDLSQYYAQAQANLNPRPAHSAPGLGDLMRRFKRTR